MKLQFTFALILATCCSLDSKPATNHDGQAMPGLRLDRKIDQCEIRADNFLQAVVKMAAQFQIPIGIEWTRSGSTTSPIHLFRRNSTLQEVVSALVGTQPGYEMKMRGGVVHVQPRGAERDEHDFLNMPIRHFEMKDDYVAVGSRRLWDEIHGTVNPAERPPVAVAGSIGVGNGDERISFQVASGTVRDVLDKLATRAHLNVWVVTYPQDPTYTSGGFRRTASVFRDSIPDEQQPQWDLLLWGFDPVSKKVRREWLEPAPSQR